jgi:hypothetical protein
MDNQAFELLLQRLDNIDKNIDSTRVSVHTKLDEHSGRIGTLEAGEQRRQGMMKLGGIIVTACSGLVSFIVTHWKA